MEWVLGVKHEVHFGKDSRVGHNECLCGLVVTIREGKIRDASIPWQRGSPHERRLVKGNGTASIRRLRE